MADTTTNITSRRGGSHLKTLPMAGWVAACWLTTAGMPHSVRAQTAARPLISGVAGLAWGSPRHEVVEHFGFPERWTAVDSGFGLTYETEVAGRPASVTFFVTASRGLLAASYSVPVPPGASCETSFGALSDLVEGQYPGVVAELTRLDPGSPDPCESATLGTNTDPVSWKSPTTILGEMNREVEWRDPHSPASVVLRLVDAGLELLYRADRSVGLLTR